MNVTPITPVPAIEQDKLAAAIEGLKRNTAYLIEYHVVLSKIRRASYEAYIASGFTADQALELCTKS